MKELNQTEVEMISGGAGVSGETIGCAIGGGIGGRFSGWMGGVVGCIAGGWIGNNTSGWSVQGGQDIRTRYAVQ